MGKSTISMVIFNSYVSHYQRVDDLPQKISIAIGISHCQQLRLPATNSKFGAFFGSSNDLAADQRPSSVRGGGFLVSMSMSEDFTLWL
jgi:hypothetical protein